MSHHCHAHECDKPVPPRMFMCKPHWNALPKNVQDAIWREYRPGQERDKRPSNRYMAVQRYAVGLLAFRPNDEKAARDAANYLLHAHKWNQRSIDAGTGDVLKDLIPRQQSLLGV